MSKADVSNPAYRTLSELAVGLATAAARVQRELDEDHGATLRGLRASGLATAPHPFARQLAGMLVPARPRVRTWRVEVRAEIRLSRETAAGLVVLPLNASYEARYGKGTTSFARLALTVEQTPFPPEARSDTPARQPRSPTFDHA